MWGALFTGEVIHRWRPQPFLCDFLEISHWVPNTVISILTIHTRIRTGNRHQGPYSLTLLFIQFFYSQNSLIILLNHGKFSKNKQNSKNLCIQTLSFIIFLFSVKISMVISPIWGPTFLFSGVLIFSDWLYSSGLASFFHRWKKNAEKKNGKNQKGKIWVEKMEKTWKN